MNKRIGITGIGVISSAGSGTEKFWERTRSGKSFLKPVSTFDTTSLRCHLAGSITDFVPEEILGKKGLRNKDRTTILTLAASKLAMEDAGVDTPVSEEDTDMTGVALGSSLGSVWSISEFDKTGLREGPNAVNPALFPNTVINSPASQVSIKFNIKGFNSTISSAFCSGMDAVFYAMNMINSHGYKTVIAGGVEELCEQTFKGFNKIGHLAGARDGKEEINCPFDKRRNGIVLGEGAAIFVVEDIENAQARGKHIYGEITGYGASFDPHSANLYNPRAKGAIASITRALSAAKTPPEDIDYISAAANSTVDCDVMETRAVKKVFGSEAVKKPMSSIKSMIGETFSASGAMNIASSLGVIESGILPPTVNYEVPDPRCDLDYVIGGPRKINAKNVLVNSFSLTGMNSTMVIKAHE